MRNRLHQACDASSQYQQDPTVELISASKGKSEFFAGSGSFAPFKWIQTTLNLLQNWKKGREEDDKSIKNLSLLCCWEITFQFTFSFVKIWKIINHTDLLEIFSSHSPDIAITWEGKQHLTAPVESKLVFLATKCSDSSTMHTHTSLPKALTDPAQSTKQKNQKDAMPRSVRAPKYTLHYVISFNYTISTVFQRKWLLNLGLRMVFP